LAENSSVEKSYREKIKEIVEKSIEIQEATNFNNKRFKDIKV
jgi:hypothetical protein